MDYKVVAWYQENLGDGWVNVHFAEQKQYHVVTADRL
jgi:hypothetical protein